MKKLFVFSIVLAVFSFYSCSDDNSIIPTTPVGAGKISLSVDRNNAPQDVMTVVATLSRSGFQNLVSSMSLTSDSSANTTFSELQAGIWHLKVDAYNANNIILYTGETDVSVTGGSTTNVSLQLLPTGNDVGTINILVTWGVSTKNWIDYPSNPILNPSYNSYDFGGIIQSMVYRAEDKYLMWYDGVTGNGVKYVLYAESQNGFYWTKPIQYPVLFPNLSSWDSWAVHPGPVIKENGLLKMYYNAGSSQEGLWHIGFATSIDGKIWVKNSLPVIYADNSVWAPQIIAWSLVKKDQTYYLFFTGRNHPIYKIGLATSSDGINWIKRDNPILSPSLNWEGTGVASPSVILEEGIFKMVYSNVNPTYNAFGYATSIDGINWTKDEQPFFRSNQTHNQWSAYKISYPCFNIYDGQKRIYYTGEANSSKIGVVQYR